MIKTFSTILITLGIIFSVIFGLWANAITLISANSEEWISWRTYLLSSIGISGFFILFFSLNDIETKTKTHLTLFLNIIIHATIFFISLLLFSVILFIFLKLGDSFIHWTKPNFSELKELIDISNIKNIVLYWWIFFALFYLKFSLIIKP